MRTLSTLMATVLLVGCAETQTSDLHGGGVVIFNELAKKVISLSASGDIETTTQKIAEAIPAKADENQIQAPTEGTMCFRKLLESTLGSDLVDLTYKLEYAFGATVDGKGAYIPYVRFVPVSVGASTLNSIKVTSTSFDPVNIGSKDNPVAQLKFNIQFKADGLAANFQIIDEFTINGETGKVSGKVRNFNNAKTLSPDQAHIDCD